MCPGQHLCFVTEINAAVAHPIFGGLKAGVKYQAAITFRAYN